MSKTLGTMKDGPWIAYENGRYHLFDYSEAGRALRIYFHCHTMDEMLQYIGLSGARGDDEDSWGGTLELFENKA